MDDIQTGQLRRRPIHVPGWRSTWPSARHGYGLLAQVFTRGLPWVGAWRQWTNNPRQARHSRRAHRDLLRGRRAAAAVAVLEVLAEPRGWGAGLRAAGRRIGYCGGRAAPWALRSAAERCDAFVAAAYAGELGPAFRAAAETAIATAVEHGYDDDPVRVAREVRAGRAYARGYGLAWTTAPAPEASATLFDERRSSDGQGP